MEDNAVFPPTVEDAYCGLRRELERSIRRICPGWLMGHRDDLVQVSLMRVMALQRKNDGKRELAPQYLKRVAYSAMVDEIRRLRRRKEFSLSDEEGTLDIIESGHPTPEARTNSRQIGLGIRDCLLRLITPRRLAVTLHLQGHKIPHSARILGWTPKKTENLLYRGLRDIRKCLQVKGITP